MTGLDSVKSWMTFFGWENGGSPGSVKRNADRQMIANAGDATWIADVEEACAKTERQAIIAELERRAALSPGGADAG